MADKDKEPGLWQQYVKGVKPLKHRKVVKEHPAEKTSGTGKGERIPETQKDLPQADLKGKTAGQLGQDLGEAGTEKAYHVHVAETLDRRYRARIRQGKAPIEDTLDLHGMTQAQAHGRLKRFLLRNYRSGARLVLVITGKGMAYGQERESQDDLTPWPATDERARGVLRRQLPLWLQEVDFSYMVISVAPALRHHGGDGAYYVHLRKPKEVS